MRGCETSSTTGPTRQRVPMTAPFTSIPSTVRFSPKSAGLEQPTQPFGPPVVVLLGVGVHRHVGPTVDTTVDLLVARQPFDAGCDTPRHGLLPDPTDHLAPVPLVRAAQAYVHRHDPAELLCFHAPNATRS